MPSRRQNRRRNGQPRILALAPGLATLWLILTWGLGILTAQSSTAEISGQVTDDTGAAITAAQVKIRNTATGGARTFHTEETGHYLFTQLAPGTYQLDIEKPGFRRMVREGVILQVGQRARVDARLSVGAMTESVEVKAEAPLLDAGDAALGQVIENRKVLELPLNGRNINSLAALATGVVPGTGFGGGIPYGRAALIQASAANLTFNGSMSAQSDVLVDGVPLSLCCQNQISFLPSVDTTEEFRVHTSIYDAQYGRTGGGLVTFASKGGSNEFHGSAYEFLRNQKFDANNFFRNQTGLGKTHLVYNQFGARLGGPILRNRTFFFVNYEGIRNRKGALLPGVVPTEAERNGIFNQAIYDPLTVQSSGGVFTRSPFAGNQVPAARFDPVAPNVAKLWPTPNATGPTNFQASGSATDVENQFNVRIDHHLTATQRLFGRFSLSNNDGELPDWFGNIASLGVFAQKVASRNIVLDDTWTLNPRTVLNLRYGYTRQNNTRVPRSYGTELTEFGWPVSFSRARQYPTLPQFSLAGFHGLSSTSLFLKAQDLHVIGANATVITGRHSMRFGLDGRLYLWNWVTNGTAAGTFSFNTAFTRGPDAQRGGGGNAFASFLLGYPASGSIATVEPVSSAQTYTGTYFQDDIRVTNTLTVNLGLRWEVETPRNERYNRLSYFDPDVTSPLGAQVGLPDLRGGLRFLGGSGNPIRQQATDWNNFGPRFGFAWKGLNRLVVRGGCGITYLPTTTRYYKDSPPGFAATTPFFSSVDGITPVGKLSDPFPSGVTQPPGSRNGLLTSIGESFGSLLYHDPVGYAQEWSFSVQRELTQNLLVDVAYAGSKGTRLPTEMELNALASEHLALGSALLAQAPNPFRSVVTAGPLSAATITRRQLLLPFPQFLGIADRTISLGSSSYHSLQLKVNKRFSRGFSVLGSYTFGKSITDTTPWVTSFLDAAPGWQDVYNRRADRSLSPQDIAQRLVISYVWEMPFGRGKKYLGQAPRIVDLVAGGWQINGITTFQSGLPVVITNSVPTTSGATRPHNVGRSAKKEGPASARLNEYFDRSVFTAPGPFEFGNAPRVLPDVRRDGINNFDVSVFKHFALTESMRLQFRAEFFNSFNTPQFGAPVGSFGTANFGVVSVQDNDPRDIQFALRLSF